VFECITGRDGIGFIPIMIQQTWSIIKVKRCSWGNLHTLFYHLSSGVVFSCKFILLLSFSTLHHLHDFPISTLSLLIIIVVRCCRPQLWYALSSSLKLIVVYGSPPLLPRSSKIQHDILRHLLPHLSSHPPSYCHIIATRLVNCRRCSIAAIVQSSSLLWLIVVYWPSPVASSIHHFYPPTLLHRSSSPPRLFPVSRLTPSIVVLIRLLF
jgi:hypothetical protein